MKYIVDIFYKDNKYIAKCTELNITAVGKTITEVKIHFVQALLLYSKDNNCFIDFSWNIIDKEK
jgi:predicted RNase H-like HicB family nuclease